MAYNSHKDVNVHEATAARCRGVRGLRGKGEVNMSEELFRMEGISKSFPGVKALDNVSFSVNKGEVHGLVGENGAGKSTLMKIMTGVYHADAGEIYIENQRVDTMYIDWSPVVR